MSRQPVCDAKRLTALENQVEELTRALMSTGISVERLDAEIDIVDDSLSKRISQIEAGLPVN